MFADTMSVNAMNGTSQIDSQQGARRIRKPPRPPHKINLYPKIRNAQPRCPRVANRRQTCGSGGGKCVKPVRAGAAKRTKSSPQPRQPYGRRHW